MSDNKDHPVELPADTLAGQAPSFAPAADEEGEQPDNAAPDTLRILEAVLFASDELITTARIKAILPGNPDAREIKSLVEKVNRQLQKERHPFEIVEIGGGYQFKTIAYYHPWVRQIFQEKAAKRLSIQALECLSIIAYRQPLSKAEIEAIRGVISDGAMKTLLEKRLITITGRSEKVGRPLLSGTTQEFLKYFGLNKISDLPNIEEFEALVRQKMENMQLEELKQEQNKAEEQQTSEGEAEGGSLESAVPEEPPPPKTEAIVTEKNSDQDSKAMEIIEPGTRADLVIDSALPAGQIDTKKDNRVSGNDGDDAIFEVKL